MQLGIPGLWAVDDDGDGMTSNEVIHIKVLSTGEGDMGGNIYIELTSEDDLFFHY